MGRKIAQRTLQNIDLTGMNNVKLISLERETSEIWNSSLIAMIFGAVKEVN